MNNRAVLLYVWTICVSAVGLALLMDWNSLLLLDSRHHWGLLTLVVLAVVAEGQAVTIRVGHNAGGSSISFLPLLTIVLLFGPAATVLAMFVNGVIAEYVIRRKTPLRANFNVGQYVLSTAIAGLTYRAAGGRALMLVPAAGDAGGLIGQLGPFVLFGVVFLVVNNAAVAGAIALSQGLALRDVWGRLVGQAGTNILSDFLIGPIAIAVAALYLQIGTFGLVIAILPLFFIRRSYLTTLQLQQANRDLLKALVKAIETRDPYTSGHSLRVSHLARRIAEHLRLSPSQVDEVETAALLHDVGKIDAVYSGILAKPEHLTPDERGVIQSHVTKGEELLRNLASVPESVILAVRHHHERPDGTGYPDGLMGSAIPIGSQIIGVCDAIDAMLSDRPYRKALSVSAVIQELRDHAGSQFNALLVRTLLETDLVSEYADLIRASHKLPGEQIERVPPVTLLRPRRPPWTRVRTG